MGLGLLELLTGAAPAFQRPHVQCVQDEKLSPRFAASLQDFGPSVPNLEV